MFKKLFFLIILVSNLNIVVGQSLTYKVYTIEDGLPSNMIYRVVEDSIGFIWIATEAGVCRYDGSVFKCYTTLDGLPNNDVFNIYIDKKSRIWLSTFSDKVACIENGQVKIQHVFDKEEWVLFYHNNHEETYATTRSRITIKFSENGTKVNLKDHGKQKYNVSDKYSLLGETYGISIYQNDSLIINYKDYKLRRILSKDQIFENILLLRHKDTKGITVFDLENRIVKNIRFKAENVSKEPKEIIIQRVSASAKFQVFYNNNIYSISKQGEVEDIFSLQPINQGFINTACFDSNNNLWIATNRGLHLYSSQKQHYSLKILEATKGQYISNIKNYKDNLIYSTDDGKIVKKEKRNYSTLIDLSDEYSPFIYNFIIENGHLIASTRIKPLQSFTLDSKSMPSAELSGLYNESRLYEKPPTNFKKIVTDGEYIFGVGSTSLRISNFDLQSVCIIRDRIYKSVAIDVDNKNIWVNTTKGVYYTNRDEKLNFKKVSGLKNISSIHYIGNSKLLINDLSNNYSICDTNQCISLNSSFKHIIKSVILKDKGTTWINTDSGLYEYNIKASGDRNTNLDLDKILDYHSLDLYNKVNDCAFVDSLIYLATNDGIYEVQSKDQIESLPYNIELKINDKSRQIELEYENRKLEIKFSAPRFYSDHKLDYFYKMEGVDSSYIKTQASSLNYDRLNAGAYIFNVFAQDKRGDNSKEASFYINIKKPWWQQYWFLIGVTLLTLFIIYWSVEKIKERERRKSLMKQKYASLELNALQSQMNPHFVFNALSSIQNLVLKSNNSKANTYITKFATLMRMFLEASKYKFVSLESEMKIVEEYLAIENLRFEDKLKIQIENKLSHISYNTLIPATLIHPFVENAIIHGLFHSKNEKVLSVKLDEDTNNIYISIDDNGIGLNSPKNDSQFKSKTFPSRGMQILNEKLDVVKELKQQDISYTITDKSDINKGNGTVAIITIKKKP